MRTSSEQQKETQEKLILAAIELFSEQGIKKVSMREIAKKAGLGEATIYNYFPSKETILFSYFELQQDRLIDALKAIPDFHEYTLQEQLHSVFDQLFSFYENDREFLRMSFKFVTGRFFIYEEHIQSAKNKFKLIIDDLLSASEEAGEIPPLEHREILLNLFWEYYSAMLFYWIHDESKHFAHTTELIDKSLAAVMALLNAQFLNKAIDLFSFFFKKHVLGHFDFINKKIERFNKIKRGFMEDKK